MENSMTMPNDYDSASVLASLSLRMVNRLEKFRFDQKVDNNLINEIKLNAPVKKENTNNR